MGTVYPKDGLAYVEQLLPAALEPGQVVVMNHLSAHRGSRVRELT